MTMSIRKIQKKHHPTFDMFEEKYEEQDEKDKWDEDERWEELINERRW